jgi:hypothetical protein
MQFEKTFFKFMTDKIVFYAIIIFITFFTFGCKKYKVENPCEGIIAEKKQFFFKEILSDTTFIADTVFRDNYVSFETSGSFDTISWKIGSDPRNFSSKSFTLSFTNFLGTIDVGFNGKWKPNSICFPYDKGELIGTKKLTIVEQVEKPNVTLSPMIGKYRGIYKENPLDTFEVRIEYFDSSKYDASTTGSKNFYWISNIPKGYLDTTSSPALAYPELREGISPEMGYKCLQFGDLGNILKGRGFATLQNDSLIISYNHIITGRKLFIGKRI